MFTRFGLFSFAIKGGLGLAEERNRFFVSSNMSGLKSSHHIFIKYHGMLLHTALYSVLFFATYSEL